MSPSAIYKMFEIYTFYQPRSGLVRERVKGRRRRFRQLAHHRPNHPNHP